MQTIHLSLGVNLLLILVSLWMLRPRLIQSIKRKKKLREIQTNNKIKKIVREYLKELQK